MFAKAFLILAICSVQVLSQECIAPEECVDNLQNSTNIFLSNYIAILDKTQDFGNIILADIGEAMLDLNELISSNCYRCQHLKLTKSVHYYAEQSVKGCEWRVKNLTKEEDPKHLKRAMELAKTLNFTETKVPVSDSQEITSFESESDSCEHEEHIEEFCDNYSAAMNHHCELAYVTQQVYLKCEYRARFKNLYMKPWIECMQGIEDEENTPCPEKEITISSNEVNA